jgi:protein-disulfide isomerase
MSLKSASAVLVVVFIAAYIGGMQLRPAPTEAKIGRSPAGPGYSEPLPSFGPENAPVYFIEVVDFNCFYCMKRTGFLKRLAVEHKNIRFIEKHLPFLKTPGSENAAIAVMAAQRQGKMWHYRDYLFAHQKEQWTEERFVEYARATGLNVEQYKKDLQDPALRRHVRLDKAAASALSIGATPTFFVNGRKVPLTAKAQDLRRMITESENEVRVLLAKGEAKTVAEARGIAAARHHPAGELFTRYYMNSDVRDLVDAN